MKQQVRFFIIGIGIVLLGLLFLYATTDKSRIYFSFIKQVNKEESVALSKEAAYAVKIPDKISFAGEEVLLDDPEVRERLDRELTVNTYWHSSTILIMKRANRFFPVIENILKEEGVPDDFKYLAAIESNLENVVSPSGAAGFWQLMKPVAAQYGLIVNAEIDERYHLEKATRVACKYLLDAKLKTGSWTAAAAAYNMGIGGITRAQQTQQETAYYHLLVNAETSRYVQRIIAFKTIYEHPEDFGFYLKQTDLYPELKYNLQQVSSAINWVEFAKEQATTYKLLRIYNPWIRDAYMLNKERRVFEVKVPV
jgi:hypothetical protein